MLNSLEGLFKRDQAIFHASLSIASVFYDTGASDLFHCQQTLNLVARRLSDRALQIKDETIGAVGLLVIHNVRMVMNLEIYFFFLNQCRFSQVPLRTRIYI